jgi:sigma-B regulation protein RsbU (phosphoserine phosphatase)
VLSAAGIFAEEATAPDVTLRRLYDAVKDELAETEMHLALFYGVVDPAGGRVRFANAGHPHAFRLSADAPPERLAATCPPLGLADPEGIAAAEVPWRSGRDRLLLFSDGLVDARSEDGSRFGEAQILSLAAANPVATSTDILRAILDAVQRFEPVQRDDRAIVVLRT